MDYPSRLTVIEAFNLGTDYNVITGLRPASQPHPSPYVCRSGPFDNYFSDLLRLQRPPKTWTHQTKSETAVGRSILRCISRLKTYKGDFRVIYCSVETRNTNSNLIGSPGGGTSAISKGKTSSWFSRSWRGHSESVRHRLTPKAKITNYLKRT